MKKLIIPLLALLVVCGCANNKTAGESSADSVANAAKVDSSAAGLSSENAKDMAEAVKGSAEAAKAMVESAYRSYISPSKEEQQKMDNADFTLFQLSYMNKYVTEKLYELIVMANDKEVETENLFFDASIWTNAQDEMNLAVKDVKITDCSDTKATAEVTLQNCGAEQKVFLALEYDEAKDVWLISDFLDPTNKSSLAKKMQSYLAKAK